MSIPGNRNIHLEVKASQSKTDKNRRIKSRELRQIQIHVRGNTPPPSSTQFSPHAPAGDVATHCPRVVRKDTLQMDKHAYLLILDSVWQTCDDGGPSWRQSAWGSHLAVHNSCRFQDVCGFAGAV